MFTLIFFTVDLKNKTFSLKPVYFIIVFALAILLSRIISTPSYEPPAAAPAKVDNKTVPLVEANKPFSFEELKELKEFQKKWADSIVKDHEGIFITANELVLPDTILFYLSKAASKNVEVTKKQMLGVYETLYQNFKTQLPERLRNHSVVIDFLPAKGYKIENWVKFRTMTYEGVELYAGQGNEKKKFGTIIGGYIVDGNRFVTISKLNNQTQILDREDLNNGAYYYKANDPNIGNMLNWQMMKKN